MILTAMCSNHVIELIRRIVPLGKLLASQVTLHSVAVGLPHWIGVVQSGLLGSQWHPVVRRKVAPVVLFLTQNLRILSLVLSGGCELQEKLFFFGQHDVIMEL